MTPKALILATMVTALLVVPPSLWGGDLGLNGREIVIGAVYAFTAALATGILFTASSRT